MLVSIGCAFPGNEEQDFPSAVPANGQSFSTDLLLYAYRQSRIIVCTVGRLWRRSPCRTSIIGPLRHRLGKPVVEESNVGTP